VSLRRRSRTRRTSARAHGRLSSQRAALGESS
jgi:hypothetical protein